MLLYMANIFEDSDGTRGIWDGWCSSQYYMFIFGIIVMIDDIWCRILLNTGRIIWAMLDEVVAI